MKLRTVILSLIALGILILNYLYGNAISLFLSISIISCILYYLLLLGFESGVNTKLKRLKKSESNLEKAAFFVKKYKYFSQFILLAIVFISSAICIRNVVMPRNATPYFYNNEYHAISNTGITFEKTLSLRRREHIESNGSLTIINNNQKTTLQCNNFLTPIFEVDYNKDEPVYQITNNIFPTKIIQSFAIQKDQTKITITIKKKHPWYKRLLGKEAKALFTVHVVSDGEYADENIPSIDNTYSFEAPFLNEGMSLYNLFFQQKIIEQPHAAALQLLQNWLQLMGDSYLLAAHDAQQDAFFLFPSKAFIDNGFKCQIDGVPITPQIQNTVDIDKGKFFYVGFHKQREMMRVVDTNINSYGIDNKNATVLYFDYPPAYWLSAPEEEQHLNNKSVRFLTNDMDVVIDGNSNEGYYFNNYGLHTNHTIQGRLDYKIEKPNDSLQFVVHDFNTGANTTQTNLSFNLKSGSPDVSYLFDIRDFSDNGFSFNKLLLYSGICFLLLLSILLFFPGKGLSRIEPIIFVVIYVLFILRMILYWRIATFPPLENISKYELEHTLRNFDFEFGLSFPIPLTLIWLFLFGVTLAVFRKFHNQISTLFNKLTKRYILDSKRTINKSYLFLMTALLAIYLINDKLLNIDMFERILSIIVPLILYIIFSILSNKHFELDSKFVKQKDTKFIIEVKAYFYYWFNNPAFVLSIITFLYFIIADRGFAVLFVLFLIFKSILLSFLKYPFNSSKETLWQMLYKPNKYWVYGIIALIIYLVILSFKSLFYYLLQYYLIIIAVSIAILLLFIYFFYNERKRLLKIVGSLFVVYLIIISIPFTRQAFDSFINNEIKHVKYRISIIHQPISELLLENSYSSFSTNKIIETAENQWFINSYISKTYDGKSAINFRPYNRVGVNYNTQTRDVVLARFVISEMGQFTMYLLLFICVLPLVFYLMSYKFTNDEAPYHRVHPKTYPGIIPLIFFFTICLFVWLTSTNRFVFFGQDFPFLSITSKTSVILPLLLFGITLTHHPKSFISEHVKVQSGLVRYAFFFALIAFFALSTVQSNILSTHNFTVIVDKTQEQINQKFNAILIDVQDSISSRNPKYSYTQMITGVKDNMAYQHFIENEIKDPYTKSIIEQLINNPYSAFQVNSPIYIQYDGYRYSALYNQHFYLELPPVENEKVWHGAIVQESIPGSNTVTIEYNGIHEEVRVPYFKNDPINNIRIAILPNSWLMNNKVNGAIIDVIKTNPSPTVISVYKDADNSYVQQSTSFASTIKDGDIISVTNNDRKFNISIEDQSQQFAINKWVNGAYKLLFPDRPKSLWIYHFGNAMKSIFNDNEHYRSRYEITLDHALNNKIENKINQACAPFKNNNKYKFSVIAADGDGKLRLMKEFVSNRKIIDANDEYAIYQLKQEQFFFSNIRNERDQWGNVNLLNMYLGPGSSIKPLFAATIASQINAGWENLILSAPVQAEYPNYAGFRMTKPWINDDHYRADVTLEKYIEASSNFYQSVMVFLGSYPRAQFIKNGKASIANILTATPGKNNDWPILYFNGTRQYFPNYNARKGHWPRTNYQQEKQPTFFGNENSIVANGFEVNANLLTKEKNKAAQSKSYYSRINIIDSSNYSQLQQLGNSTYLWSMPEESVFMQHLRAPSEIHQNVNIGLKTTALGGYPYQLTPFKALEMYMSLFSQNRAFRLHLDNRALDNEPWFIDSTWSRNGYNNFLAQHIFNGMHQVVNGAHGTAKVLSGLSGDLYIYAKTGTINEQGSNALSSRRLVVILSDKDLQQPQNIGYSKIYAFFFMVDRNQNFDWQLVRDIITETTMSKSFKHYFNP